MSRRPNGDGSIRKRSDGRWEGRIVIGHKQDGKPMYKSVFGKTQKEMYSKFTKAREYYAGMNLTEESLMTLSEWLDKWLDEHKRGIIRESTMTGYKRYSESYIKPYLGKKRLTQITSNDIQRM